MASNPALCEQLREMARRDQHARRLWGEQLRSLDDEVGRAALWQPVAEIDRENTAALKAIIAEHGWPGISLVGEAGADAAWCLAQHADDDREFQREALALLEQLLGTGEIDPAQHAYLYDRVAVAEGRPQRFGTQFPGGDAPAPIEDEAHVDERRGAIGLPSMAVYAAQMREIKAR